jgi:hypothetical protein
MPRTLSSITHSFVLDKAAPHPAALLYFLLARPPHPSSLSLPPSSNFVGTVRGPRTVPKDADCAASLKKRTLTNLYNERPARLELAHRKLDAAVFAAYGWAPALSDDQLLEHLLKLSLERSNAKA